MAKKRQSVRDSWFTSVIREDVGGRCFYLVPATTVLDNSLFKLGDRVRVTVKLVAREAGKPRR